MYASQNRWLSAKGSISSALAMGIQQSYTKPLKCAIMILLNKKYFARFN